MRNKLLVLFLSLTFSAYSYPKELVAINVALVVAGSLKDKVTSINHELKTSNKESFLFDSTHIPHITILQFYTEKGKLDFFIRGLTVEKFKAVKLKVKDFESSPLDKDPSMKLLNLVFQKDEKLNHLQSLILFKSSLSRVKESSKEAFIEPETIDQQFVDYVKAFTDKEVGADYSPHITLGIVKEWDRDSSTFKPNEEYSFDEMIVSQMGNYGTVRKIIKSIKLDNRK